MNPCPGCFGLGAGLWAIAHIHGFGFTGKCGVCGLIAPFGPDGLLDTADAPDFVDGEAAICFPCYAALEAADGLAGRDEDEPSGSW